MLKSAAYRSSRNMQGTPILVINRIAGVLMLSTRRFAPPVLCCILLSTIAATAVASHSPKGMRADAGKLHEVLDPLMEDAVANGVIPGGVLLIGHNRRIVYRKAFGSRSLEPNREPMTIDTTFDLASLTKCVATATSLMKLVQDGRIRLN